MNSNKIALALLNIIIFAGIFFVVYNFYYLEKKAILNDKTNIYNKFYDIKVQVDNFDNIRNNIKDQEYRLEEIFAIYNDYYKSNDEIISSYKDMIEDFLKQHEIKITSTTINQEIVEGSNNISLLISLTTSYDRLYQLIFDIERFSSVSDLKISYLGNVSFRCAPNLYSQEINDYFLGRKDLSMGEMEADGYFKEISDKVIAEMNIGEYTTWKDLFPIPKNPLFPGYVPKKDSSKKKGTGKVFKPLPSGIVLQGVMYEANIPIAIIDSKLLKVGNVHKGVRIVKINKNNVDVEYYNNIFNLKMAN